jgi:predicted transcriptional regulator of viral defense system
MKITELKKINNLLIVSKESLRQLEPNEQALNANIKYWVKKGDLIRIKKGRYILKSFLEKEEDKESYLEYLANKIYQPSYLSCEYVMQKYGLLTEAVYGITGITTRKTKIFINQLGQFTYYSITPSLFFDFEIKKYRNADILIAKKQKAVFDFLYLRFLKNAEISAKAVEELRINWENFNKGELTDLKIYGKKSKNQRIIRLISLIEKQYYD